MANLFLDTFAQKRCAYCQKPYKRSDEKLFALCECCSSKLIRMQSGYCKACGTIQNISLKDVVLERCDVCDDEKNGKSPPWEELHFFNAYEGILKGLIRYAKFHNSLIFTKTLAQLLIPIIEEFPTFDLLIPLPMHDNKMKERGYNQCIEIAKFIRKNSSGNFVLEINALHKSIKTKPQASLSRKERLRNVNNSFRADSEKVAGKTVLLLDDVSTTGASLRAASKALLEAKAKKVYVLYIAGTPLY